MAEKSTPVTLSTLRSAPGARRVSKRVGRGPGSGKGKTSGRGHKGHKARQAGETNPGFEGGQMPMYRRLPKRGFTNPFKQAAQAVNLKALGAFAGKEVTAAALAEAGVVSHADLPIKVLGDGEAPQGLVLKGLAVSAPARAKIEAAGGRIEE